MATEEELDIIIKAKDLATKALEDIQKDLRGIGTQTKKTNTLMVGFRKGLDGVKRSVFSLRGAFAALGLGLVARSFVQAASTAEQYRVRLRVLMGDVEEANKLFQDMSEFASGVSFEYEQIMGSATALAGVMKGGREEISQWMPMISDLAATAGMGIEETTSQIIRMYSAGAASADMFRERGILAMLGFQAGVSVSAEKTRKQLIDAWEDPASKFRGASILLSNTWEGMLSMMSDAWFQFRNMVMEQGVYDYIRATLDLLLQKIRSLKKEGELDKWAVRLANGVITAFEGIIKAASLVKSAFDGWRIILLGIELGISKVIEWFWKLTAVANKSALKVANALKFLMPKEMEGKLLGTLETDLAHAEKQLSHFQGVTKEIAKDLETLLTKPTAWEQSEQLIKRVRLAAVEVGKAVDEAKSRIVAPTGQVGAGPLAMLQSDLNKVKELSKTYVTEMNSSLEKGNLSLKKYYDERERLSEELYKKEVDFINKKIELEEKDDKKQALRDKLFALEQAHHREMIGLQDERIKKQTEFSEKQLQAEQLIANIRGRVLSQRTETLRATFAEELRELDNRQNEEMKNIRELTKVIQDESKKRQMIKDAETAHAQEKNQLLYDQERRLQEYRLKISAETAGGLAQVFSDLYEVTGQKTKEFFYLSKAAAIAEAIINNSLAITKVMAQGGWWGIAQAGLIAAKGALEISKISAQTLAGGGLVLGTSPSPTADDKLIAGTSGEFMEPVSSVRHYGLDVMEGIRRKIFPKEMFSSFNLPGRAPSSFALAGGGTVPAGESQMGGIGRGDIVIANFYNKEEFLEFLSTAKGRGAIVNAVIQEKNTLKRVFG